MTCVEYNSPDFISKLHNAPFYCSLTTTDSVSSASVWSDSVSQYSDDTSISSTSEASCSLRESLSQQSIDKSCEQAIRYVKQHSQPLHVDTVLPLELRQNPRRSSTSSTTRSGCPPPLVRQADRKVNFVDNLVDSSTQIVEAIWPTSSVACRSETVLPLRTFIQETLRRSKTSYSTLQVALYYLILIKPHVPDRDFTMEQPDDCYASRALQCGRRMFLAALILASKYLQDRNYSARAWSKISGLATHEINQNEMAFLIAVNWKLHITNEIYRRWTDGVMKFSPSQPPSPGSSSSQQLVERQCEDFKKLVLNLTPELDNIDFLAPCTPISLRSSESPAASPRSVLGSHSDRSQSFGFDSNESVATPKAYGMTPVIMEPIPATVHTPGRLAPALGLLPTPRLTPQTRGFCTPAVSAVSHFLGKGSMGFAMSQASNINATQALDRWPASIMSSPLSFKHLRRSSLANSVSTASSPESMVSDTSRTSRSSSISSASSLASAPTTKLDVQARCRYAKQCSERLSMRPTIAPVPESLEEQFLSSSPEPYVGPTVKDASAMSFTLPARDYDMDDNVAALALQELHNYQRVAPIREPTAARRSGLKRSRTFSIDNRLQDNVRDILGVQANNQKPWSNTLVRSRSGTHLQVPVQGAFDGGRKRLCCASEVSQSFNMSSLHPAIGRMEGPGMWEGILN